MFRSARIVGLLVALATLASPAFPYGPFNHLCAVDRNWDSIYRQIRAVGPLDEFRAMDAVFAGAISDDLGYYFVKNPDLKLLTNETHYMRTGEWVDFLLRSARDPNNSSAALDYAFALGVLSHYAIDRMGHYYGTNVVAVHVAQQEALFGPRMSYERNPHVHTTVEAGFDAISLTRSCSADKLSDRFYAFLREPGWPDGEQVFGFVVRALRQHYGGSLGLKVSDLVQALVVSRLYIGRLMLKVGSPYASKRVSSDIFDHRALQGGGFYGNRTDEEIKEEEEWIDHQIGSGIQFSDQAKNTDYPAIFENSFSNANALLTKLLNAAEQLRGRQDDERRRNLTVASNELTFPNINLDVDETSVAGRYDLADCTAEQLLQTNSPRLPYPATSGGLAQYFAGGKSDRSTMNAGADKGDLALRKQLMAIAFALDREHQMTENAIILNSSWKNVHPVHQAFAASCPGKNTIPFGPGKNICVGPGVVYWKNDARALSLLFASSAASGLLLGQSPSTQKAAIDRELSQRKDVVESFRLCDPDKDKGYLGATRCKSGEPTSPHTLPPSSCVGRD